MKTKNLHIFISALLFSFLFSLPLPGLPNPSPAALKIVETLRATELGVDRVGNLWAFHDGAGTVQMISPAGERLYRLRLPAHTVAVDADAEQGVVAIALGAGFELHWLGWDGVDRGVLSLPDSVTEVRFVGPGVVAASPQTSDRRVEIWDLKTRKLLRAFGEETRLTPGIGATQLRAVMLRFDPSRDLLYAFESFTGDLRVFHLDGRPAWRSQVENPDRPRLEEWLRTLDRDSKIKHDVQRPVILALGVLLDGQGRPWILQSVDLEAGKARMVEVGADRNRPIELDIAACPSSAWAAWGEHLLFFRPSGSPSSPCFFTRRFP